MTIQNPDSQPTPATGSCPYCAASLSPPPQRKKKCPECGNPISVRTDPKTGDKVLLTEESLETFEKSRALFYGVRTWKRWLEGYGVGESKFLAEKEQLSRQFGFEAPDRDVVWRILTALAVTAEARRDYQTAHQVHFSKARFLAEEGKNTYTAGTQAARMSLLYHQGNYRRIGGTGRVRILARVGCPACRAQDGKEFTIKAALDLMPLPCRECTNERGYCRCDYNWVSERTPDSPASGCTAVIASGIVLFCAALTFLL